MVINGAIDENGMLVKPQGHNYDSEIPQLVLIPYFSDACSKESLFDQTIDICFRKNANTAITAKKLQDFPQSITMLEKLGAKALKEPTRDEGSVSMMSMTKDPISLKDISRLADELDSEKRMYEVRIPMLLSGERLLGETPDPGALKIFLVLYSYESQQDWDHMNTCITVKK